MKLRKQPPTPPPSKMTLIPADTKGPSEDGYPAPPQATTSPFPNPIFPNQAPSESDFDAEHPPPYTPIDSPTTSSTRDIPPFGARDPQVPLVPSFDAAVKIPESNGINAHTAVNIVGPLHVLGAVKSSSSVTLTKKIIVDGKVSSSSSIVLENDITVQDKVDASGHITLRDGVKVGGKVDASGHIV